LVVKKADPEYRGLVPSENSGKKRHGSSIIFFFVSLLGSLYLLLEAGLQVFGRSVCVSEGCGLVGSITRFGDLSTVLIGFLALGLLSLLSGLTLRGQSGPADSAVDLILITALAAEGFFVGYQIFWLPEVCLFCLSVLGIILTLGFLRFFSNWKVATAGFAAWAVVLCFVGLVLPPRGTALPSGKKMILFYSEDCRHCTEIRQEIDHSKFDITPVLVKDYTGTLKTLGVDSVPTLYVNSRYEKLILTGKEAIRRYLAACQSSKKPIASGSGAPAAIKGSRSKSGDSLSESTLSPWGATNPIFNPSHDEGLCKEHQNCD
jgi:hypothetical protein